MLSSLGYGTIFPTTSTGQLIFIFYAFLGIPLALVFLSDIGAPINKFIHSSLKPVKRRYGASAARGAGVVCLVLITGIFFVMIPAAILARVEAWSYRESVYFIVVSLTTVGFGDYVPSLASLQLPAAVARFYAFITPVWLWIGLL